MTPCIVLVNKVSSSLYMVMTMNSSVDAAGGEAIIFEVVRITSRGRVAHVSDLALIFMDAEAKQLC